MVKKLFQQIMIFSMVILAGCNIHSVETSKSYFLDPINGNDSLEGISPQTAWQTLAKASLAKLNPGDQLLLKAGEIFGGSLFLNSLDGTPELPIRISSYGNGKATILSETDNAIRISNSRYVDLSNIIAFGSGRLNGNLSNGIEFENVFFGSIDSVEVSGYLYSGLSITDGGEISITNVYAHNNGFSGILITPKDYNAIPAKQIRNIYIGFCVAENNPGCPAITHNHSGNGILMTGVTGGIIEYCEAFNNGWDMPRGGNGPVGIWAAKCDSIIIQHCYAHNNKTSTNGHDGGGFDFDGGITNSIMQYNLSALNEGAGYGMYQYKEALEWDNNIVRYNISYLDGRKNAKAGIHMWLHPENPHLPMRNLAAYNNTIINDVGHGIGFEPGVYENFVFENNILYLTGKANQFIGGTFEGATFDNNIYWSEAKPLKTKPPFKEFIDSNKIITNPFLVLPSADSDLAGIEPGLMKTLEYFQLKDHSPARGKGKIISNSGQKDFWGNWINDQTKPNIGAYDKQ